MAANQNDCGIRFIRKDAVERVFSDHGLLLGVQEVAGEVLPPPLWSAFPALPGVSGSVGRNPATTKAAAIEARNPIPKALQKGPGSFVVEQLA